MDENSHKTTNFHYLHRTYFIFIFAISSSSALLNFQKKKETKLFQYKKQTKIYKLARELTQRKKKVITITLN